MLTCIIIVTSSIILYTPMSGHELCCNNNILAVRVAVSRAIRVLSTEGSRPGDWYSTKNCALQYALLLESVAPSKRKRDKLTATELPTATETPGEMLAQMLAKRELPAIISYYKLIPLYYNATVVIVGKNVKSKTVDVMHPCL